MHNVLCGGAKVLDDYLTVLVKASTKICVVHGDKDQVVPMECINTIKMKAPHSEVNILRNADHSTVILGREKEFAQYLEHIWASLADIASNEERCLKNSNTWKFVVPLVQYLFSKVLFVSKSWNWRKKFRNSEVENVLATNQKVEIWRKLDVEQIISHCKLNHVSAFLGGIFLIVSMWDKGETRTLTKLWAWSSS